MTRVRSLILVLIVTWALVGTVSGGCGAPAPGSWGAIRAAKKMVVGTSADYPPFEYLDEKGQVAGFDIDLIQKVGGKLGVAIELRDISFDSLLTALEEGKVDAVIAYISPNAKRQEKVDFTQPYYQSQQAVLVGKASTFRPAKPEDLAGHTIGLQTGSIQDDWVREQLLKAGRTTEKKIVRYPVVEQAVQDLAKNKVEAVFTDLPLARAYATKLGLTVALVCRVTVENPAIAVRKGSRELRQRLDKAIADLKKDGTLEALITRYLSGQ